MVFGQYLLEIRGEGGKLCLGLGFDAANGVDVSVESLIVGNESVDGLPILFVNVAEDVFAKAFDLPNDIPIFVVGNILPNVGHHPGKFFALEGEPLDELVDGLLLYLKIVESDAQVGCEVELAGEIAENALKKGVDGLYAKVIVVVQQMSEGLLGTMRDDVGG